MTKDKPGCGGNTRGLSKIILFFPNALTPMKHTLKQFNLEKYLATPESKRPELCTGNGTNIKFVGIRTHHRYKVVAEDGHGTLLCYDTHGSNLYGGGATNALYFKVPRFEEPPPGHKWYNSAQLSPEVVGPRHRLLSSADQSDGNSFLPDDHLAREQLEFYDGFKWIPSSIGGYVANLEERTYRLPIRAPFANGLVLQEDETYKPISWFEERKAHKRGCKIQFAAPVDTSPGGIWTTVEAGQTIDWDAPLRFRVLPAQRLADWTEETYPFKEGILWLKHKQADTKFLVTGYDQNGLYFGSSKAAVEWSVLKSEFIQLDGSPCGTLHDIT